VSSVPVFYHSAMSIDIESRSPSAGKPIRVIEDWLLHKLDFSFGVVKPLDIADLMGAHSPAFVNGVFALGIDNGFGTRDRAVNESLLWTNGSFVAAAEHVAKFGGFACSPTSGFHHAGYSECGGFCTFNGLMIAAYRLIQQGSRVGILDMDFHFGDGTADIIEMLSRRAERRVSHVSGWSKDTDAEDLLDGIPNLIDEMDCDVLFYQAGADMHLDDPLGGCMTTAQLRERDRVVFQHCRKRELPCVWCLAGGYAVEEDGSIPKVLEIHRNTMLECIEAAK